MPLPFIFNKLREPDPTIVADLVAQFLAEDSPEGDITTGSLTLKDPVSAFFVAREEMIFSGSVVLEAVFDHCDLLLNVDDGQSVYGGQKIATVTGPAGAILQRERVALNLIQRLSGIATLTSRYVQAVAHTEAIILDTRKTSPGLRYLEKYAVACGGGSNHRMNLSSGIMIKDNHLAAAGGEIADLIDAIRKKNLNLPVELEVDTIEQLEAGILAGADGFLLDNMTPEEVAICVTRLRAESESRFVEASGGITLANVALYAETGVAAVSIGALTHSASAVDIGLDLSSRGS